MCTMKMYICIYLSTSGIDSLCKFINPFKPFLGVEPRIPMYIFIVSFYCLDYYFII